MKGHGWSCDNNKSLFGQVHNLMKEKGGKCSPYVLLKLLCRFEKEAVNGLCALIFSHTISYFHKPWKKSAL